MPTIRQHVPSFVDLGEDPLSAVFETTQELLSIPFVKSSSKYRDFSGYALSDNELMSTNKRGKKWWVIGHIDDPSKVELPKWEAGMPGVLRRHM